MKHLYSLIKSNNENEIIGYLKCICDNINKISLDIYELYDLKEYKYTGYFIGLYYYIDDNYNIAKKYFNKYPKLDKIGKYILECYDYDRYLHKYKYYEKKYGCDVLSKEKLHRKFNSNRFFVKKNYIKDIIKYILIR